MLVIGLGIGLIIMGIIALATGRLKLSKGKAVQGVAARLLGLALLTPLPLGFLAAIVYTFMNVNPNNQAEVDQWAKANDMTLNLIVAGVEIGLAILIIIIAACLAKPLPRDDGRSRRRARDDYDDYEETPRRRRVVDEDDDRPQRRRDVDEHDDRPRRRDDDDR